MACYGSNSNYAFTNTTFTQGDVATSGGALILGFNSNTTIEDCDFTFNNADFGGAIYVQTAILNQIRPTMVAEPS